MLRDDHDETRAFLGRLERADAQAIKALEAPTFPGWGGGFGSTVGGGWQGMQGQIFGPHQPGARHDYAAQAGDLRFNSAIAGGLSWIGDNFAEAEPITERRVKDEQWEVVPDHPLTKLIRKPNPFQSWQTLAKATMASYKVKGDGFWLISKGYFFAPGDEINLWWMPHDAVRPVWDPAKNEFLSGWAYFARNQWGPLALDQVVHFQDGIDPNNYRLGMSPLQACFREVCSDNEVATYTSALLRNFGIPSFMISPADPGSTLGSKEERQEIAQSAQAQMTGENRGKPLVPSMAMKLDRLGFSPEELALDKIPNIPESRICAALRLNAMVLGLNVGSATRTFSNYGEARTAAYEDCLCPAWREWGFVIDRDLLPILGDPGTERFRFRTDHIVALSESEDAKFARAGDAFEKNKLVTKNEGRRLIGQAPVPTGDVFADGTAPELPEGDAEAGSPPVAGVPGAVVQDQALNGAQIASMLTIAQQIAGGQIPVDTGQAMIVAAFPNLTPEQVDSIVGPLRAFKPAAPEPAEALPGKPPGLEPAEDRKDDEDDKAIKALLPRMAGLLDQLGARP